jgi:organic radical activating enzyme
VNNGGISPPFRVGILVTERCDISCAHCWLGDPSGKPDMNEIEAKGYIDQAAEIPTVEWISFTGGEPFLVYGLLVELAGYVSEKGLRSECVTNCSWATTRRTALERLAVLRDAGLEVINISSDDFHQRYIPFSRVENCYYAARDLDLRTVLMSSARKNGELRITEIVDRLGPDEIKILGGGERPPKGRVLAVETGFIPASRGADLPVEEMVIGESPVEGPCRLVLRDVGVDPRGGLLACCSASGILEPFNLGSLQKSGLGALIDEAGRDPLFRQLSDKGPLHLAGEMGLSGDYVSRCHVCHDAVRAMQGS